MLILGYLIGLNTLNILFFHHDISYKVSSDSFITAMKLPLLYLKDLSSWLINMSVVQWIKLVSWKWGCESTSKISKFSYCQFWFRWNDAIFLISFLFFLINDKTKIFHCFGWHHLAFVAMYYKAQFLKQIYCFYQSKEIIFKALIYSNYVINVYCNCISLLSQHY